MPPPASATRAPAAPRRWAVRSWALWRAPRRVVLLVLAVDVLALVPTVPAVVVDLRHADRHEALTLGLLLVAAVVHAEISRRADLALRVPVDNRPAIDLKSTWTFAALLLLPLGPALLLVVVGWCWWTLRVTRGSLPHRIVYSCASALLATVAAWNVLGVGPGERVTDLSSPAGLGLLCLAALVRWTVNNGLVCAAIRATDPSVSWRRTFLAPGDVLLGAGALVSGVVLAVVWQTTPWFVPLLAVPLLVMHRGFLLPGVAHAARTDAKTGLLTAGQWRADATRALARSQRRGGVTAVLMVDLDDFKALNDAHGHLVGDEVLGAVAAVIAAEVSDGSVGRFGGEEFSVLATGADARALEALAHRLRARIADLAVVAPGPAGAVTVRCTASIGTALAPHHGTDLDELLLAADAALYAAKAAGRDRVRAAPAGGAVGS